MVIMVKIVLILGCFLAGVVLFVNLGRMVDATQPPVKADLIVSLGGDSGCRLQKAKELFQAHYASSHRLLYTGDDVISGRLDMSQSKRRYLLAQGVSGEHILHVDQSVITNTMEELFFVKQYMKAHGYTSVLFVTHPHHSGRVAVLANSVARYQDAGLRFRVIGCQPSWWDRAAYYKNSTAVKAALREAAKTVYNLIKYATPLRGWSDYWQQHKKEQWHVVIEQMH